MVVQRARSGDRRDPRYPALGLEAGAIREGRAQKSSAPYMLYGVCVGGAATSTKEPFSNLNVLETPIVGIVDIGSFAFLSA